MLPPLIRILELFTAFEMSTNVNSYSISFLSFTAISISSSGNPDTFIWDIPSISLKSFSIFFEIFFKDNKSILFPVSENITVASCSSIFETITGSISVGKEETLSTAFFTSNIIASIS